jgi:protein-S-isoprenylcysteine O-methyltransferase Ste14
MIQGLVFVLFYFLFLAAIFFIAAGTIQIPAAWISLGSFAIISIVNLFLVDPDLISERLQFGGKGVNRVDRVLASGSFLFFYPLTLFMAGLDVGRYQWTQEYSIAIQVSAIILYIVGNLLGIWAMVNNRYFSTFVRIQEDRHHEVETRGPYRVIRHPGYAGTILSAMTLPLALGSVFALIPALIGSLGFVVRTAMEDNELIRELEGYRDYAERVRYRLVPKVW